MTKDPTLLLNHILECLDLIEEYVKGKTHADFLASTQLQDAIIRRIEIIGEASKGIPPQIKDRHQEIPWKRVAGMRDILIHEYFGVDLELTWRAVVKELPDFKKRVHAIREELKGKSAGTGL